MKNEREEQRMERFAGRVLSLLNQERDTALQRAAMHREEGKEWQASAWAFCAERLQKIIAEALKIKKDLAGG